VGDELAVIYLIRHGETDWNREDIFRGRADISLSPRGQQQAGLLAASLARQPIRAVYSSPLVRACETAKAVADRLGLPVVIDHRLVDMSFGEWEGKSLGEVQAKWPELHRTWTYEPAQFRAPGGESLADVLHRAWPAMEEITTRHGEETVALVSHRVVCKLLACAALGVGEEGFWRLRSDTASVSLLQQGRSGWQVTKLNDIHHLDPLGAEEQRDF
jgi:broad specificity phosphatase PhoE